MARFYGAVGYVEDVEKPNSPSVIVEKPVEHWHKGEMLSNFRNLESTDELNGDVKISNKVKIVADPYAAEHMHAIRYIKWRGCAWKVQTVESVPPSLILTLGGVYNGEVAE